jgi:ketosteroid isomerase-like protein
MTSIELPDPIQRYFTAKSASSTEDILALFASDAVAWDHGEDLELRGLDAIRNWMTGTVSGYDLTTTAESIREQDGRQVVRAIVSGNFPGSPYAFNYTFLLTDGKIAELAIDPIGPVGG